MTFRSDTSRSAQTGPVPTTPDLQDVAVFVRVVETGGFSAAAAVLGLPKSTVSRRVAHLEDVLGVRLLHRTTRRMSVTEAGAAYHEQAGRALANLDLAAAAARDHQAEPRGVLRISAPPDADFLAEACARFVERFPDVQIEIEPSGRLVDLVREGFDLAIRAGAGLADSTLVARKLAALQAWLFVSPNYARKHALPTAPAELAGHPFVLFRPKHQRMHVRLQGPDGTDADVEVRGPIGTDDFAFLTQTVLAGAGLGLLPVTVGAELLLQGHLLRVLPGWSQQVGSLSLVYPTARHLPAKTRAFRDFALAWFDPPPWERAVCAAAHASGERDKGRHGPPAN